MTDTFNPLLIVSWNDFHSHTYQLARKLRRIGTWKAIVGITRGGLAPATIIAREFDNRMVGVLGIASYHTYDEQGELQILQHVSPDILKLAGEGGKDLLVIDDLSDTGRTFKAVRRMFPKAHCASVYAKFPAGFEAVDTTFITVSADTWIRLPWDTHPETLELREPLAAMTS